MKLKLKVVPGSSKDCIVGWLGDALKIKTKAPPEKGKANIVVSKLIADALDLSISDVEITSGLTQGNKIVEIQGISSKVDIASKLNMPLGR